MPLQVYHVRYGQIVLEWERDGSLSITRQDNGMRVTLSLSEWGMLLQCAALHGYPTAPPAILLDDSPSEQST